MKMTFDINNAEHRSSICAILNRQFGGGIWIIPKAIREGNTITENYQFTMDDFVVPEGIILPDLNTLSSDLEEEISNNEAKRNSTPSIHEKLAKAGITIDELKEALGI